MKTAKRLGLGLDLQREEKVHREERRKIEGRAEGREQEKRNIIREMLQDHIPDYKIKQYTSTDKEISRQIKRAIVLNVCAYYWKVVKFFTVIFFDNLFRISSQKSPKNGEKKSSENTEIVPVRNLEAGLQITNRK